jgi:hypothetical protein
MTTSARSTSTIAHSALVLSLLSLAMLFTSMLAAQETTTTTSSTTTTDTDDGGGGMETAFGFKGGANWSTIYLDEARDMNTRMGFHFGLFGRVAHANSLGIQAEALYEQKGATFTRTIENVDQQTTYKFDYITVPLMLVVPLGEVIELHAGGYGGAMILSERKLEGDLANSTSDPGDGRFTPFDFGLVGGAGINLDRVQLGARYSHGLTPIADNDVSRLVLGDSKNASLQAYIALALGKRD